MGIIIVCVLALFLSASTASPDNEVDVYLNRILKSEGGFQEDEDDGGNYLPDGTLIGTNRGITPGALSDYWKVDPNSITLFDIESLTENDAREIYKTNYYYKPKINLLPSKLQPPVLDMYINAGSAAIKILQREAGMVATEQDGIIGPKTLLAVEVSEVTIGAYADARIFFYINLTENRPKLKKYLNGWIARANKYR
jgi:lysozyme family protein